MAGGAHTGEARGLCWDTEGFCFKLPLETKRTTCAGSGKGATTFHMFWVCRVLLGNGSGTDSLLLVGLRGQQYRPTEALRVWLFDR